MIMHGHNCFQSLNTFSGEVNTHSDINGGDLTVSLSEWACDSKGWKQL